jgi:hypothetical protein
MDNENNYKSRLKQLAKMLGLSDKGFSRKCGLREDFVNKPGKSLSSIDVGKIYHIIPDVNLYWLMFGEGENMLINPDEDTSINRFVLNEYREMKIENRQLIAENAVLKQKLLDLDNNISR